MKVLVLGATGFIGFPAAQAFVRDGHEVYGQTRNADKTTLLAAEEIIPVIAHPADGAALEGVAAKVDVVLNCLGGNEVEKLSITVLNTVLKAARKARPAGSPRLTYIYTSGAWVHGDDRNALYSERSPPKNTNTIVAWRPPIEARVAALSADPASSVDGIVVRPSLLYGRGGSLLGWLFGLASKGGEIVWPGKAGGRWSLIHVDDLSRLYVALAEAAPITKGLIFDATNDSSESVDDILQNVVQVSGSSGFRYRDPMDEFEEASSSTVLLRPSLARALVRWRPLKPSLVDGLSTYYAAWKATKRVGNAN